MRRLLALALLVLIAGCAKEKTPLTFHVGGTPNELAYWETLAREFTEETGVDVQLLRSTTQTEQRKQSILVALRGQKADPDVMLMDVAWIGQMAASGWLEPLAPHGVDQSLFFERIIKLADTHEGKLVGVPLYVDGGLLYYRTDLLRQYGFAGPPETWEQLRLMASKVQAGERPRNGDLWGYVWQGAQYEGLVCNALEVFLSAGGGFLDESGKPILNSPQNVRALSTMVGFIHEDPISPPNTFTDMKEDEVRSQFQVGDAVFERNWPYAWALHNAHDSPVKGKFGIAPLPHFPDHRSASTLGGWHVSLSRYSDRKADAAKFIQYITSYEVQKRLARDLGWNPGRTDVYDDAELNESYPALSQLRGIFANAAPRPTVPYYSEMSTALQRSLNAALAGTMSAQEALEQAQKEVSAIVEQYQE
jgi:multiple sugar transport system substrate-binding protein